MLAKYRKGEEVPGVQDMLPLASYYIVGGALYRHVLANENTKLGDVNSVILHALQEEQGLSRMRWRTWSRFHEKVDWLQ